jgi:glycosyltransferase involved in cell wall biosynthesis
MKISFVNYLYDEDIPIREYLNKYPTTQGWCKALTNLGIKVNVYHRFSQDGYFEKDGAEYFLFNDGKTAHLKWYENPVEFHKKICQADHEIVHVNSFVYSHQASMLKRKIPSAKFVIQHHAERPGYRIKRFLLRRFSSSMNGFIFASKGIYDEWVKARAISPEKKFAEIMEGSSDFNFQNRIEMKRKTGLNGMPVLLWVGRLNDNKDPLTVLSGFSKLLNNFSDAKLYMIYNEDDLKQKILTFIEQNPVMKKSVKLLGFINHSDLGDYYNSSDYFVLGSHYEGSGFSLVEAMSCGVVPIVTDIPSFRMMTSNGQIGGLWKCGDAESFYICAKLILSQPVENESKKSLTFFSEHLSYPAIGKKAKEFYESLIG